jgi:Glycosyltransferase family 87
MRPWIDAASGAFIPADIAQDIAAARLFIAGVNPYGPQIRDAHAQLLGLPVDGTFPHFPHPPFSLIISWPLGYASYPVAAAAWFAVTIALVFVLAALLAENISSRQRWGDTAPEPKALLTCFGLLLAWPPVLYNLEKGQWSILLAVLVALGWRSLSRARVTAAGAWLGAAAAVKVFPVVLGGYLLLRSRRAFIAFGATGALLTLLPLLRIGFEVFPDFIRESRMNLPYWETYPSVVLSLHGALVRLLIGGQWARPAIYAPMLARIIEALVVLVLLALATRAAIRARRERASAAMAFAAWVVMLPVLNPQSLGHNGVLLALPFVLTARALRDVARPGLKVAWALALGLVSIPKQTVWRIAAPPIDALEGLAVVALPMWGALLLFAVIVVADAAGALERIPARRDALP